MQVFKEAGIPADRELVAGLIGSDGRHLAHTVSNAAGRTLDHTSAEHIDRRAGEIYSRLNRDPKPLDGASELLRTLDKLRLPWAIATSSRREQVDVSIAALKLSSRPTIIDASQVEHAKPAPDLLLVAAQRLGIPPAQGCYVGDAIWDMRAAKAAGMPAIGVTTGSTGAAALLVAGAQFAVASLADLRPYLPVE